MVVEPGGGSTEAVAVSEGVESLSVVVVVAGSPEKAILTKAFSSAALLALWNSGLGGILLAVLERGRKFSMLLR